MKKITVAVLSALLAMGAVTASAETKAKVIVDNKVVKEDVVVDYNRTFVPLRAFMENAGAEVVWEQETNKIYLTKDGTTITLQIGSNVMNTASGDKILDVVPTVYTPGTTYLPIRAVCEEFGMNVDWDSGTNTVLVTTPNGNPYVDKYDGRTIEEYASKYNTSPSEVASLYFLDYADVKGELISKVVMMMPISSLLGDSGSVLENYLASYGVTGDETITMGEFQGEMTLERYFGYIGKYGTGSTPEQALEEFKAKYGLGDEYTLETKYKYVRTITDTYDVEHKALTDNKINFTITMNDGSVMKGELYPDIAPITVANFTKLAKEGFYDGLIFHRVIDGFVIQGGAYDKDFNYKDAETIKGEFAANGVTNNLSHYKGVISMARTNDPDSASSQFFIMDEASAFLDGNYAAFGRITEGFAVINKISEVETGANALGMTDVPLEPVIIETITIDR